MGIHQGFGDGSGSKGVGLNEDGALGFVQLPDNGFGASTFGGEVGLPSGKGFLGEDDGGRESYPENTRRDGK